MRWTALVFAALAAACGGGGDGSTPTPPPPPPPQVTPIALSVSGMAVVKAQGDAQGFTLLEEKALALTQPGPDRRPQQL